MTARFVDSRLKRAILASLATVDRSNALLLRGSVAWRLGDRVPIRTWHNAIHDLIAHGLVVRDSEPLPSAGAAELVISAIDATLNGKPLGRAGRYVPLLRLTGMGRLMHCLHHVERGNIQRNSNAMRRHLAAMRAIMVSLGANRLELAIRRETDA